MFDFKTIRGESAVARRFHFEQLLCRLAALDGSGGEFRRIDGSGGDGGVEALRLLPSGKKVGYQAKYFTGEIDWNQIDDSVQTAIEMHPELERYVIAIPREFTGTRAIGGGKKTDGMWGKWDEWRTKWEAIAASKGMQVTFEVWTASELEGALMKPAAAPLIRYFFPDKPSFTPEWLRAMSDRTIADLQARYSPEDHVDTDNLRAFDVIFRRESVCRALEEVFDDAAAVDLQVLSTLISSTDFTAAFEEADQAFQEFSDLRVAVAKKLPGKWPVCRWILGWHSATRPLISMMNQILVVDWADELQAKYDAESTKVGRLIGPQVFGGRWNGLLPIDGARAVLFVGRAGAGKSHLLAKGVEQARSEGAPVIHLLGQHIGEDPRASMLDRFGLADWSFQDLLAALDLAAEAASTRALLVIDAMNEGKGLEVWRGNLAGLLREVNAFERIVLAVSCREEYLPYVVSDDLIAQPLLYPHDREPPVDCEPLGKLVRVEVTGFQFAGEREAALQKFMDAKGIARPTTPILDDEFFNPLFLSSVCRSMQKAGLKVFPRGLHGTSDIFGFVLATKAKSLGTRYDGTPRVENALRRALDDLAAEMLARKEDCVSLDRAHDLVTAAFSTLPLADRSWLEVLEGSDIVRRDVEHASAPVRFSSRPDEVIRFSFQRLQDHLLAQWLLRTCGDFNQAFGAEGSLEFLVQRLENGRDHTLVKPVAKWVGLLGAVWAAVAEMHGLELCDLPGFLREQDEFYPDDWRPAFLASVRERKADSFKPRTRKILNFLWETRPAEKLGILLATACVPGHSWNADSLAKRICALSPDERTHAWSTNFTDVSLSETARNIIDWSLKVETVTADADVLRLASLTLACLCLATNEKVQDLAQEALTRLLQERPSLVEVVDRFRATLGR